MKIVVLDGYTLNPGDLNWSPLLDLGDHPEIYERTAAQDTVSRAPRRGDRADQQGHSRPRHARAIAQAEIRRHPGDRDQRVDLDAARERGIVVTNVPAYSTASVVQLTLALLLEITQRVGHHAKQRAQGNWVKSKDFAYWDFPVGRTRRA